MDGFLFNKRCRLVGVVITIILILNSLIQGRQVIKLTKRKENIKQHFVPQTYYRNFSSDGNTLKVLDIKREKEYISSIDSISYRKYFYDVDSRILPAFVEIENIDEQLVDRYIKTYLEDEIGVIFNKFKELSHKLKNEAHKEGIFELDNIESIMRFIIIQSIRTPSFRKQFDLVGEELNRIMSFQDIPFQLNVEEWTKIVHNMFLFGVVNKVILNKTIGIRDWYKNIHNKLYTMFEGLVNGLQEAGYFVLSSEIETPLITSDNPVCIEWLDESISKGFSLLILPVTKENAILFYNRDSFKHLNDYHQSVYVIDESRESLLENINLFVTKNSSEKIYSNESYKFIKEKLFIQGEIRMKIEI